MNRIVPSFLLVAAFAAPLHAQAPAASAEADALFDQGKKLLEQRKIAEACTAFAASQRVSPLVSTQMNLADCREQNKELATAYGLWRDVERQTRAPIDDATKKMNKFALGRVKAIEPRLSKLTIDMETEDRVPGLEITRNDVPFDPLLLGQQLPIDGGSYTVVARARGYKPVSVTVDVAPERDGKIIHLPPLQPLPREEATAATTPAAGGVAVAIAPPDPPSKVLPYVVGGAGVVLLGTALGLDLWARSQYDDAKREPDDFRQEDLWSGAKTKRYIAQGMTVAGVAAVGVGAWLFWRARTYDNEHAIQVAPSVDADGAESRAGVTVFGSF